MDIRQYISSGVLEQFVLGELSAQESREVMEVVAKHPEIARELDAIEAALEHVGQLNAVTPPPGTEAAILQQIRDYEAGKLNDAIPKTPKSGGGLAGWLLGLALVAMGFWAYTQFMSNQTLSAEKSALATELAALQADCDTKRAAQNQQIAFLRNPNTTPVVMAGTPLSPSSVATVFYNATDNQAFLDISNLPTPAADQQYQLWAIVDGNPVDMGVFDIASANSDTTFQSVPFIENSQAFAVTLEPKGGSVNPTLDQMYVVGNVG